MPFPSSVGAALATGVAGELVSDAPIRCRPGITKGATPANIAVGRWFTQDPADLAYTPGGTNAEGGLLINPKGLASYGAAAGPLAPTLVIPAGTPGEFASAGEFYVTLSTASQVGQGVFYNQTTGILGAGTAGAGETQIAGAKVTRYNNAAPGLAAVSFNGA